MDIIRLLGGMVQSNPATSDVLLIIYAMSVYKGTWWDSKENVILEGLITVLFRNQ